MATLNLSIDLNIHEANCTLDLKKVCIVNNKLELIVNVKKIVCLGLILAVMPILSGCWLAAAAGAGAYGGYKMKEKGYTIQNPVTKEKNSQKKSE